MIKWLHKKISGIVESVDSDNHDRNNPILYFVGRKNMYLNSDRGNISKVNKPGVSLIELLLYVAIFGMVFLVMVQFYFFINDNNQYANEALRIDRASIFIDQHIGQTIKEADSINDPPASTFNDNYGVLSINISGANHTYALGGADSNRVQYNDGVNSNFISGLGVEVNRFYVEAVEDRSGQIGGVRVTIEVGSRFESNLTKTITNTYLIE